jgi:SAM-dependent methyltransferase
MTDMNYSFRDFDESTYLELNPDVSEAVQNGSFSSGLEHYFSQGFLEDRHGVPPAVCKAIKAIMENVPIESAPPDHLRKRVHGDEDLSTFEGVGRRVSFNIHSAISSTFELDENQRILDFGYGCGRVIRYFHLLSENSHFYGTDIDEEAIAWCQNQLGEIGEFITNEESPPLPFGDEFFDFIYEFSEITRIGSLTTANFKSIFLNSPR